MGDKDIRDLLEKEHIRELVQETAALLDSEQLDQWVELFANVSEYEIVAHGNEIAARMTWWRSSREELRKLLDDVPRQVRDKARRLHLVSPVAIQCSGERGTVQSHFAVFRTTAEGRSSVYAVGRYDDTVVKASGRWVYEKHQVVLDTRMLDTFTHLPL